MAVATATSDGTPSVRMLLFKGLDERGFRFYSSYESRKGRELAENARAALLFYWHALGRQIRIDGAVERLTEAESDAYFSTRPRGGRVAAWASRQSKVVADRAALERAFAEAEDRFAAADVPRPPHWGGYRVVPATFEFWQHRDNRLHDRLRYAPDGAGGWVVERLSP